MTRLPSIAGIEIAEDGAPVELKYRADVCEIYDMEGDLLATIVKGLEHDELQPVKAGSASFSWDQLEVLEHWLEPPTVH